MFCYDSAMPRRFRAGPFGILILVDRPRTLLRLLARAARARPAPALTPAEQRVAEQLGAGATVKEIAESLGVEHNTVKTHVAHIYRKLGLRNRGQFLAWWAAQNEKRARE